MTRSSLRVAPNASQRYHRQQRAPGAWPRVAAGRASGGARQLAATRVLEVIRLFRPMIPRRCYQAMPAAQLILGAVLGLRVCRRCSVRLTPEVDVRLSAYRERSTRDCATRTCSRLHGNSPHCVRALPAACALGRATPPGDRTLRVSTGHKWRDHPRGTGLRLCRQVVGTL